jgi:hypothetical protein
MAKINVKSTEVTIIRMDDEDYISLTDIARFKTTDPNAVIGKWNVRAQRYCFQICELDFHRI